MSNGELAPYAGAESAGDQAPPPERRLPTGTLVSGALAALALVAGVFFAFQAATEEGGADNPEAAVRDLVDAISGEDVLGALGALVPAERSSLRDGIEDTVDELERLDVLADGFSLRKLSGVEISFADVELTTEELTADLATVTLADGRVRGVIHPRQLQLGTYFDLLDRETGVDPRDADPKDESSDLDEGDPLRLATVRRDGRWYVSLWYTIAEQSRRDADLDLPDAKLRVDARGAPSPEQAVEQLAAAAADLDVRGMIALLPPGEADALHDYAPLFLDDTEESVAELREEGFEARVERLETEADRDGDEARVELRSAAVSVATDDGTYTVDYDGERLVVEVHDPDRDLLYEYEDKCLRVEGHEFGEHLDEEVCEGDPKGGFLGLAASQDAIPALRAVEVDGRWYVSPTRSILGAVIDALAALDGDDLERATEWWASFFGTYAPTMEET